mgnify:CR=1 FL=1
MRKSEFPFPHVVIEEKKEVWIRIDSSVTAMGIPALMQQYFPGYTGHIASGTYFKELLEISAQDH